MKILAVLVLWRSGLLLSGKNSMLLDLKELQLRSRKELMLSPFQSTAAMLPLMPLVSLQDPSCTSQPPGCTPCCKQRGRSCGEGWRKETQSPRQPPRLGAGDGQWFGLIWIVDGWRHSHLVVGCCSTRQHCDWLYQSLTWAWEPWPLFCRWFFFLLLTVSRSEDAVHEHTDFCLLFIQVPNLTNKHTIKARLQRFWGNWSQIWGQIWPLRPFRGRSDLGGHKNDNISDNIRVIEVTELSFELKSDLRGYSGDQGIN